MPKRFLRTRNDRIDLLLLLVLLILIGCIIALLMDNDRAKAEEIYNSLRSRQNEYLLQGEVKSDLAIMEAVLFPENAKL